MENADLVMAANLKSKKHFELFRLHLASKLVESARRRPRKIFLTIIKKAKFHADFKSGEKGAKNVNPNKPK
jgi:hypothetical protein